MTKLLLLPLLALISAPSWAEEQNAMPVYKYSSTLDFWATQPTQAILLRLAKDAEENAIASCQAAGHPACALAEITGLECAPIQSDGHEGLRCIARAAAAPLSP